MYIHALLCIGYRHVWGSCTYTCVPLLIIPKAMVDTRQRRSECTAVNCWYKNAFVSSLRVAWYILNSFLCVNVAINILKILTHRVFVLQKTSVLGKYSGQWQLLMLETIAPKSRCMDIMIWYYTKHLPRKAPNVQREKTFFLWKCKYLAGQGEGRPWCSYVTPIWLSPLLQH